MTPFCPCSLCALIRERDPKHVIRESTQVAVIPEDDEHTMVGVALCAEHYIDWVRTHQGQPLLGLSGGVQ